ncbi:MAG: hypothetical protein ABI183_13015 [Polyangiaceae bacterium]
MSPAPSTKPRDLKMIVENVDRIVSASHAFGAIDTLHEILFRVAVAF